MSIWLACTVALADIPPPADYVEECTLAKKAVSGKECRECSASHVGREACLALEAEGFASECRSFGGSVWTEVLCRPAAAPAPGVEPAPPAPAAPPAEPAPSSSRCDHTGGFSIAWLLPLVLLGRRRAR